MGGDLARWDLGLQCRSTRIATSSIIASISWIQVHPFYQTTGLDAEAFREVNQITTERASDRNRPLLFDHSLPGMNMPPADAARYLIAQQGFSVGGLFGLNHSDPPGAKYAPSSPLLKSAICLATGTTVFETLMLNWRQYNQDAEVPFPFVDDDKPAWERDEPTTPTERRPRAGLICSPGSPAASLFSHPQPLMALLPSRALR